MSKSEIGALPSVPIRVAVGIGGSILLHVSVVLLILFNPAAPSLGVEFFLPNEVEFGLTEGATVSATASGAAAAPEPSEEQAITPAPSEDGIGAGPRDGGVADAETPRRRRRTDGGVRDGGGDAASMVANAGDATDAGTESITGHGALTMYAPPGAQLSVRLDLATIRQSPLRTDVAALMRAIPDWQMLLDGSDIDPIEDLDRLFIASTNLQRENWVISGRYPGDIARVHRAVELMATARGVSAEWTTQHGIPVAPWPNLDAVERRIALVGPNQFTITRPDDLRRVLGVARARARELAAQEDAGVPLDDGDALLAMGEGEVFAADVEGAHNFVRGMRVEIIPSRVHAALRALENGNIGLSARGDFQSQAECESARGVWDEQRTAFAHSIIASYLGLAATLNDATLTCTDAQLTLTGELTQAQVSRLMSLAALSMPQLPPARTEAPNPTPPPTTPPPATPPATPPSSDTLEPSAGGSRWSAKSAVTKSSRSSQ